MSMPGPEIAPLSWRHRLAAYLAAHWRGEHSLARAFWLNAVVLGLAFNMAAAAVVTGILLSCSLWDERLLLLPDRVFVWIMEPVILASAIWQIVGVFRSARRALVRGARVAPGFAVFVIGGPAIWGQIDLALDFQQDLAKLQTFLEAGRQHAAPPQPLLKVSDDGTTLLVAGEIGEGFADAFRRMLQDHPQVRTVNLTSRGGLRQEALDAAALIRSRKLDTRAVRGCYSACTTLFLAGHERILRAGTRLGFHAPARFPGDPQSLTDDYEAELKETGLPAEFARRVVTTPYERMWYPSLDELFAAGVVTHLETTPAQMIETLAASPP